MENKFRQSTDKYASKLPEGVSLKYIMSTKSFRLTFKDGTKPIDKHVETVLMWKPWNAANVFAYIARRAMRETKQDAD